MPQNILPENPADEFDFRTRSNGGDWLEIIDSTKPGGAAILTHDKSEDTIEILIPANKVRSACRQILGYAYADTGPPWRLHRPSVPIAHAGLPWLWANGFAAEFLTPKANLSKPHPDFPGFFVPEMDAIDWVGYGPQVIAKYRYAKVTIRYGLIDFGLYPDSDPYWNSTREEWRRFVGLDPDEGLAPKTEIVQAEGGADSTFYFAATDKFATPAAPTPGTTPFKGQVYVYKTTGKYKIVWRCVPEEYCCTGTYQLPFPKRIFDALGKVNTGAFLGSTQHGRDTLIFDDVRGKRYQLPLRTDSANGLYAWDWYMSFDYFNPSEPAVVKDSNGDTVSDANRRHGHQLRPDPNSLGWYYASRGTEATRGTMAGIPAVDSYDMNKIFLHVSDPT